MSSSAFNVHAFLDVEKFKKSVSPTCSSIVQYFEDKLVSISDNPVAIDHLLEIIIDIGRGCCGNEDDLCSCLQAIGAIVYRRDLRFDESIISDKLVGVGGILRDCFDHANPRVVCLSAQCARNIVHVYQSSSTNPVAADSFGRNYVDVLVGVLQNHSGLSGNLEKNARVLFLKAYFAALTGLNSLVAIASPESQEDDLGKVLACCKIYMSLGLPGVSVSTYPLVLRSGPIGSVTRLPNPSILKPEPDSGGSAATNCLKLVVGKTVPSKRRKAKPNKSKRAQQRVEREKRTVHSTNSQEIDGVESADSIPSSSDEAPVSDLVASGEDSEFTRVDDYSATVDGATLTLKKAAISAELKEEDHAGDASAIKPVVKLVPGWRRLGPTRQLSSGNDSSSDQSESECGVPGGSSTVVVGASVPGCTRGRSHQLSELTATKAATALQRKIRTSALELFQLIVKTCERKSLFGYWFHFIPDSSGAPQISHHSQALPHLLTLLLKEPCFRIRISLLHSIEAFVQAMKPYLMLAEKPKKPMAFTSLSAVLASSVCELHRVLLLALVAERAPMVLVQMLKCLTLLVSCSAYDRIDAGLLVKVDETLRPFVTHSDVNVGVAALTVYNAMLARNAKTTGRIKVCPSLVIGGFHLFSNNQPMSGRPDGASPWLYDFVLDAIKGGVESGIAIGGTNGIHDRNLIGQFASDQRTHNVESSNNLANEDQNNYSNLKSKVSPGHLVNTTGKAEENGHDTPNHRSLVRDDMHPCTLPNDGVLPLPLRLEAFQLLCQLISMHREVFSSNMFRDIEAVAFSVLKSDSMALQIHSIKLITSLINSVHSAEDKMRLFRLLKSRFMDNFVKSTGSCGESEAHESLFSLWVCTLESLCAVGNEIFPQLNDAECDWITRVLFASLRCCDLRVKRISLHLLRISLDCPKLLKCTNNCSGLSELKIAAESPHKAISEKALSHMAKMVANLRPIHMSLCADLLSWAMGLSTAGFSDKMLVVYLKLVQSVLESSRSDIDPTTNATDDVADSAFSGGGVLSEKLGDRVLMRILGLIGSENNDRVIASALSCLKSYSEFCRGLAWTVPDLRLSTTLAHCASRESAHVRLAFSNLIEFNLDVQPSLTAVKEHCGALLLCFISSLDELAEQNSFRRGELVDRCFRKVMELIVRLLGCIDMAQLLFLECAIKVHLKALVYYCDRYKSYLFASRGVARYADAHCDAPPSPSTDSAVATKLPGMEQHQDEVDRYFATVEHVKILCSEYGTTTTNAIGRGECDGLAGELLLSVLCEDLV